MNKTLMPLITSMFLALFLSTACTEKDQETDAAQTDVSAAIAADGENAENSDSLMDKPVDFSTPEQVEATLQNIREKEGESAYKNVVNTMQYLMVYDLSIGQDEDKLHKKLNGLTPNEIIAKMKRRSR